jgi:hypothetical protein
MTDQMVRAAGSSPPGMNAPASKQRPMKWGYTGDQVPLMGRSNLAHGSHAWAVAVAYVAGTTHRENGTEP